MDGMGGTTGTGGMSSTGMSGAGGSMGGATSTTNTMSTATTSSTASCPDPLEPAEHTVPNGNSGDFGTTDSVCYRVDFVPGQFGGWGSTRFAAPGATQRSVNGNGTPVECGEMPLPAAMDGSYFFVFGEGIHTHAFFYWYGWE